jgi:UrcA family protein
MRKINISVVAALSLAVVATPAVAETMSITVPYSDLDLSSPAGMATLQARVDAAAKRICGRAEVRRISDATDHDNCVRQTQASVSIEIARVTGNRNVLALNSPRH